MSDRTPLPELSDEQVALADQGIEQFEAFVRDVLRQPETVNEIPSGSTRALVFAVDRIRFSSLRYGGVILYCILRVVNILVPSMDLVGLRMER
jgi:hypothetical protein